MLTVQSVVDAALAAGADLAGVAPVGGTDDWPSQRLIGRLAPWRGTGTAEPLPGAPTAPWELGAVVVVAVSHPAAEPALDWWWGGLQGGTEGNRRLMGVVEALAEKLAETHGLSTRPLSYHPERGGVFLKDAAVLAGLGCLGKNNLLITPEHGPRVRLRALGLDLSARGMMVGLIGGADRSGTGSPGAPPFDPCAGCPMPCRRACPQEAMGYVLYDPDAYGSGPLPAREGVFDRERCNVQMQADEAGGREGVVKYCRRCELSCVVGKKSGRAS